MSKNKLLERLFATRDANEIGPIVQEIQAEMPLEPVDWQSDLDYVLERARAEHTTAYLAYRKAKQELDAQGVPVQTVPSRTQTEMETAAQAIVEAKAKAYDAYFELSRASVVLEHIWRFIKDVDIIVQENHRPLPPIEYRIN